MFNPRTFVGLGFCLVGLGSYPIRGEVAQTPGAQEDRIVVVQSNRNDVSLPLRDMPIIWPSIAKSPLGGVSENTTIPDRLEDGADPMTQGFAPSSPAFRIIGSHP